jgi:xanthine dehydrogenase accessory factor
VYDIAAEVQGWIDEGRPVTVAIVVETTGFSNRDPAAAAAATPDRDPVGALLDAAPTAPVKELLADPTPRVADLVVSDQDAVAAGLACGGLARVLVTGSVPPSLWRRLLDREPVGLVTELGPDGRAGTTRLADAADSAAAGLPQDVRRGVSQTVRTADAVVTVLWPTPRVVVVGSGAIPDAIAAQARLLGWTPEIVTDAAAAEAAIAVLSAGDGVVVTSHDRSVDGPALAAAVRSRAGYVGALGSRRTQDERRAWLAEHGITDLSAVHGPAGLDLGGSTPAEIALAIAAEMLATRAGGSARSLRDRSGAIHR